MLKSSLVTGVLIICCVFVVCIIGMYIKSLWIRLVLGVFTRTCNSSDSDTATSATTSIDEEEDEEELRRRLNNRPLLSDVLSKAQVEKLSELSNEYTKNKETEDDGP